MTGVMKPIGPRHISALRGIHESEYTGFGANCTFRGVKGPAIPCRLMAGLVDRGLATVTAKVYARGSGETVWVAHITEQGLQAIGLGKQEDMAKELEEEAKP